MSFCRKPSWIFEILVWRWMITQYKMGWFPLRLPSNLGSFLQNPTLQHQHRRRPLPHSLLSYKGKLQLIMTRFHTLKMGVTKQVCKARVLIRNMSSLWPSFDSSAAPGDKNVVAWYRRIRELTTSKSAPKYSKRLVLDEVIKPGRWSMLSYTTQKF